VLKQNATRIARCSRNFPASVMTMLVMLRLIFAACATSLSSRRSVASPDVAVHGGDETWRQISLGASERCFRQLARRFLALRHIRTGRGGRPARENGRLRPLGVSAMTAPQCVHGAIGESYLQLKQLEAITQVRLTPVSTYR
jgi:hypothetical protein